MKKQITACDGCEVELKNKSDVYHLEMRTDRFWDGEKSSFHAEHLDFCQICSLDMKRTLEKILKRLREK